MWLILRESLISCESSHTLSTRIISSMRASRQCQSAFDYQQKNQEVFGEKVWFKNIFKLRDFNALKHVEKQ